MSTGSEPEYVFEPDDGRTGSHIQGDETGCAEEVPRELWDPDGDPLARGEGEEDN